MLINVHREVWRTFASYWDLAYTSFVLGEIGAIIRFSCLLFVQLLLIALLGSDRTLWTQQISFGQRSFENTSSQIENRLDTIIALLQQSRQGSIIQLSLTIIVSRWD